ncbi:PTS system mannose-specific transporter subunit IID [Klebsiella pneumoniae]|uniref:PTS system mannose-specific transporter subunit IID n=1 Tax=Klebsiella pneumoniae TaxID=573 RepID=A0A2X3F6S7_KLEPN|nr:PTS system mannose-specific transporter subunit IID [Klebsiella pneumoniae]
MRVSRPIKRHLEFFNTHPYVAAPVLGVTLAMEEQRRQWRRD